MNRLKMKIKQAVLLGLLSLTLGCAAVSQKPTELSRPPAICLESTKDVPEAETSIRDWALSLLELYTDLVVTYELCQKELLKR